MSRFGRIPEYYPDHNEIWERNTERLQTFQLAESGYSQTEEQPESESYSDETMNPGIVYQPLRHRSLSDGDGPLIDGASTQRDFPHVRGSNQPEQQTLLPPPVTYTSHAPCRPASSSGSVLRIGIALLFGLVAVLCMVSYYHIM